MNSLRQGIVLKVLFGAATRFHQKQGWVLSSHVAMSLMLALFPFVLFTVAMAGALTSFLSQDIRMQDMIDLVFGSWPDTVSGPIVSELNAVVAASNTRLMTLGGVFALYFASNGVDAIRIAMTQAYRDEDARPFWKTRLLCLFFVLLGGAGILCAAVFEVLLPLASTFLVEYLPTEAAAYLDGAWQKTLSRVLILVMPLALVFGSHIWLPGHVHGVLQVLPGVVLTVVLWWVAGLGFSVYVASFASYSATYAGLAGAMAALIFLYLNAAILIFGAEVNGALIEMKQQAS